MAGLSWTTIFWFYLLIAGGICVLLVVYLIPHRLVLNARYLMLLMIAVGVWSLANSMEIRVPGLAGKLVWVKLEYFGGAWIGILYFLFILVTTGKESWLTRKRILLLSIIPIITIVLAVTNSFHHLIWTKAWLNTDGLAPLVAYSRGLGFWLFIIYTYLLMVIGTIIVIKEFLIAGEIYRKKLLIVLLGALVPWVANGIYLLDLSPVRNLDLTPFAFTISGLAFAWGLYRYQLMNIISLAHKTIIEGMEDVVFVLDGQDRILDLNNAAEGIFGISLNQEKGMQISNFSFALHEMINNYRKEVPTQNEVILAVAEESLMWNLRISPLYEKRGSPSGWLIILQDITERKKAEESIRESEEKFRSITANALDGIIMIDSRGKISFWNKAAESIFGYSVAEAIGMDLHKTLAPEEANREYEQAVPVFKNSGFGRAIGKTLELKAINKQGDEIPIELSVASLKLKGEWHAVGIVRDITVRKRTRDLMIQTEKMISVGGLAAGMAHELNNPLGGMVQGIQTVIRRFSPDLKANQKVAAELGVDLDLLQQYMAQREITNFLNAMLDLGKRASTIIFDMLKFSRKSESKKALTDLTESVRNSIELARKDYNLKKKFDFKDINVKTEFEPNLSMAYCHQIEIEQVILNLLRNAAQAMAETAQKRAPQIVVRLKSEQNWVRIEVEDNGPGMDPEAKQRVFEPFYTTKPVGQGTGLGLSVSYMIITNNHQGTMEVESETGKGTRFIIRLPLGDNSPS